MAKMIFVNLPVSDVARSTAFYEALGFVKNAQFSNANASSFAWTDTINLMVLDKAFYAQLVSTPIADTQATSGAAFALSFDSKAEVDAITEAAIAAGGKEGHPPEDEGFMYSRAFRDPDGHAFGPFWMNPEAAMPAPEAVEA